ncbi:sigma-54 interaction domain-containing protein [Desulfotomaculum copahuensis]|uniref:Sigma-54-dependent Fis family transcriptional regulator n=1 Tax=Desulfotomaculum copahuensis TaxID=1838280 RepID=A0A1B7LHC0_9FIRM|nr:sigma-54-dependent Fis family transcriptional regulator [Desulfotomaculum copahuensis]OAT85591.1 sigma-54-dependent Fis family transcriptional regulator [Desulfotomaculum copahuensis]
MTVAGTDILNRLRAVLDATYNGIIEVDGEGLVTTVNRAMERILGQPAEQLTGRHIQELVPGTGLMEVLQTGQPQIGCRTVIGGRSYVSNRTPIILDGRVAGAVAVLQDETELQHMLEELESTRNLKELLETVLDSAYDGIVVVDDEARITMFNRAYCEFLGVKQEDVLGRRVQDVIENTRMHVVLQTGRPEVGEVQRINGHDMVCSRIPLKRDGRVWAAVGKVMFRDVSDLRTLVKRVDRLQTELEYYKGELQRHQGTRYCLDNITGASPRMRELKALVPRVARSDSTVLIRGESGTGKELFAHALHNASPRAHRPFVKVNCAALPENLLESELFGYAEGAFTGARKGGKIGKFELADGGTIFLDEIGDMPVNMQVKLLRVLQEKEIERLGENRPLKVDVRVVAATNRNLEEMVQLNLFREDLFYRLNVVVLDVPPLRDRREDIPALVDSLLKKLAHRLGCPRKSLAPAALECLLDHHWPGNIRELENVLERVLNIVDEEIITINHLPFYLRREEMEPVAEGVRPLKESVENLERIMIVRALEATAGDCLAAARLLQVGKSTFYEKLARYGIPKK